MRFAALPRQDGGAQRLGSPRAVSEREQRLFRVQVSVFRFEG